MWKDAPTIGTVHPTFCDLSYPQHVNPNSFIKTYQRSLFTKSTPESHFDFVLVACSFIKTMAAVKWWTVQVKADCSLCMTHIFHSMQPNTVCD